MTELKEVIDVVVAEVDQFPASLAVDSYYVLPT